MPIDYGKYPANWKTEIRPAILERAGNKCEECSMANGMMQSRENDVPYKVVLTVAHLDHNINHNNFGNLKALCQRCHLQHDAKDNARRRATGRAKRGGQLSFLEEGGK